MSDAQDPYDWETYAEPIALGHLAARSSPVVLGYLTRADEAARRYDLVLTRRESRSFLELLDALPGAEAAARRWQGLGDWAVRAIADGRPPHPGEAWRRGDTWESRTRAELRRHPAGALACALAPGVVLRARSRRDAVARELVVTVTTVELTDEQRGRIVESLTWRLSLWAWSRWTARVALE